MECMRNGSLHILLSLLFIAVGVCPVGGQELGGSSAAPAAVRYEVDLSDAAGHMLDVRIHLDRVDGSSLYLTLPSWTVGANPHRSVSNISAFAAEGDRSGTLPVVRTGALRWRVDVRGEDSVHLSYRYYANDPLAGGAQLDRDHAFLTPGAFLLRVEEHREAPVSLRLKAPSSWRIASSLEPSFDPALLRASSWMELAGSPLEVSAHQEQILTAGSMSAGVVFHPVPEGLSGRVVVQGLSRLADRTVDLFRVVPARNYLLVFHFARDGGMEARGFPGAGAIHWGRPGPPDSEYLLRLSLAALVRSYTGALIQPAPGGEGLTVSDVTWFTEGAAEYLTERILIGAGRNDPVRLLDRLGREITRWRSGGAVLERTAAERSLTAWTEQMPADPLADPVEDLRGEGFLLSFALDMEMRDLSGGDRSLDDLAAFAARWYGRGSRSLTDSRELVELAGAIAGGELEGFLTRHILGREEPAWEAYLARAGWSLQQEEAAALDLGFDVEREAEDVIRVRSVDEGSPAARAGLLPGDRLMMAAGLPPAEGLRRLRQGEVTGSSLPLVLRRAGESRELNLKPASHPVTVWRVVPVPDPTAEQQALAVSIFEPGR